MKIITQDGLHKYEVSDYFVDLENATIYGNRYRGEIIDKIFLGKYENEDLAARVFKEMIDYDSVVDGCFEMYPYDGNIFEK